MTNKTTTLGLLALALLALSLAAPARAAPMHGGGRDDAAAMAPPHARHEDQAKGAWAHGKAAWGAGHGGMRGKGDGHGWRRWHGGRGGAKKGGWWKHRDSDESAQSGPGRRRHYRRPPGVVVAEDDDFDVPAHRRGDLRREHGPHHMFASRAGSAVARIAAFFRAIVSPHAAPPAAHMHETEGGEMQQQPRDMIAPEGQWHVAAPARSTAAGFVLSPAIKSATGKVVEAWLDPLCPDSAAFFPAFAEAAAKQEHVQVQFATFPLPYHRNAFVAAQGVHAAAAVAGGEGGDAAKQAQAAAKMIRWFFEHMEEYGSRERPVPELGLRRFTAHLAARLTGVPSEAVAKLVQLMQPSSLADAAARAAFKRGAAAGVNGTPLVTVDGKLVPAAGAIRSVEDWEKFFAGLQA